MVLGVHVVHGSRSPGSSASTCLIAFLGEDDFAAVAPASRINAITGAPMSQFLGPRFKGRSSPPPSFFFFSAALALAEKVILPEEDSFAAHLPSFPFVSDLSSRPRLASPRSCMHATTPLPSKDSQHVSKMLDSRAD